MDQKKGNQRGLNPNGIDRKIAVSYLREKYKTVLVYLFIVAVFFMIAFLYGYEQLYRNMLYAVLLAIFFGGIFVVVDYLRYYRRCRTLFLCLNSQAGQEWGIRLESLPEPAGMQESLYQDLLENIRQEQRRLVTEYDEKKKDMADYYTMWTHQIKTPIAALRLLLQEEKPEENAEYQAGRQAEREELFKIEQYAEMALYFARLDSLSSDLLFRTYEVRDIVKQAVRKYSVLFLRSGLSFQMEEFGITAVTDEKWLSFVVEQVFSNALKYTHQGGIAIYGADAEGRKTEGRTAWLVVEDTGIGIRESDLPRIFERGFTGYNGRIDKKSTGIGLYLCDQIMRRMSHTIRVVSAPGKGTKVILGFVQETAE